MQMNPANTETLNNATIGDMVELDGHTGRIEVLDFVNGCVKVRSLVHGWERFYPLNG